MTEISGHPGYRARPEDGGEESDAMFARVIGIG